jgi:aspartyl/asparaginyl-tRNA synthetase
MTVELMRVRSCTPFKRPYTMLSCDVLLEGVEEVSGGQRRTVKHNDLWEYTDGEWFYVASFMSD